MRVPALFTIFKLSPSTLISLYVIEIVRELKHPAVDREYKCSCFSVRYLNEDAAVWLDGGVHRFPIWHHGIINGRKCVEQSTNTYAVSCFIVYRIDVTTRKNIL